jgi:predicted ABC-type sugar transport system permease subunit
MTIAVEQVRAAALGPADFFGGGGGVLGVLSGRRCLPTAWDGSVLVNSDTVFRVPLGSNLRSSRSSDLLCCFP